MSKRFYLEPADQFCEHVEEIDRLREEAARLRATLIRVRQHNVELQKTAGVIASRMRTISICDEGLGATSCANCGRIVRRRDDFWEHIEMVGGEQCSGAAPEGDSK